MNHVHQAHKCTYVRQYHQVRPYVTVSKIPNFDPKQLPFWDIYENEGTAETIKVGGTMAGEFTAGLSGGQRKLMLFEIMYQRTKDQKKLLLVLDEPFAGTQRFESDELRRFHWFLTITPFGPTSSHEGVTDDFVPWIVARLNLMRQKHNILLVTNDHVQTLTEMADNTITVSAIDRSTVKVNDRERVSREKAIMALSVGDDYVYKATDADFKFFMDVEVYNNGGIMGVVVFALLAFTFFLASFWGSEDSSAALVLVAGQIIAYFSVNPYLLSLVDWRNFQNEEAEALLHASKELNRFLKTTLTITLILLTSLLEFGILNAVVGGLSGAEFWVGMLFDSVSLTFPFICIGLYTNLPHQAQQMISSLPFLFMIFFSTTFSPGSGVPVLKELRYLFSRYYFWCIVPVVDEMMEDCPSSTGLNVLYMIITGLLPVILFVAVMGVGRFFRAAEKKKASQKREAMLDDNEFQALQLEMYGEQQLRKLTRTESSTSIANTMHSGERNV